MNRAHALLEVRKLNDEQRTLSGIASTPTPDRAGDIVDPMGAEFLADLPLFLYHDTRQVVGRVSFGRPTAAGIPYTAKIPKVLEEGRLRDRVDEAWHMLKYRLITGVSIGFRPIGGAVERLKDGGQLFKRYELLELSLVPIPANAEATVDQLAGMAFGRGKPAVAKRPVVYLDSAPTGAAKRPGVVYLDHHRPTKRPGVVYLDGHGAGVSPGTGRRRVVYLK